MGIKGPEMELKVFVETERKLMRSEYRLGKLGPHFYRDYAGI